MKAKKGCDSLLILYRVLIFCLSGDIHTLVSKKKPVKPVRIVRMLLQVKVFFSKFIYPIKDKKVGRETVSFNFDDLTRFLL